MIARVEGTKIYRGLETHLLSHIFRLGTCRHSVVLRLWTKVDYEIDRLEIKVMKRLFPERDD